MNALVDIKLVEGPPFSSDLMKLYDPPKGFRYVTPFLTLDTEKADEYLLQMFDWFEQKKGHYRYNNVDNAPQNILRPGIWKDEQISQFSLYEGTLEEEKPFIKMRRASPGHLQWIFPSVGSDRRQDSTQVYKNHTRLYYAHPMLYHGEAQYMSQPELEKLLRSFNFGIPEDTSSYWPDQCRTLFQYFDGDPIKLLNHCGGTVAGVLKFKKDQEKEELRWNLFRRRILPGFAGKITSLLFLFYEELGVFKMPDDAFAVDVHVQRFFMQTGALVLHKTANAGMLEKILRPYLCGFTTRYGKNKVDLAHALWQNGAKMCDVCSQQKGASEFCSVEKLCFGPIDTSSYSGKSQWEFPLVFNPKYEKRPYKVESKVLFR